MLQGAKPGGAFAQHSHEPSPFDGIPALPAHYESEEDYEPDYESHYDYEQGGAGHRSHAHGHAGWRPEPAPQLPNTLLVSLGPAMTCETICDDVHLWTRPSLDAKQIRITSRGSILY